MGLALPTKPVMLFYITILMSLPRPNIYTNEAKSYAWFRRFPASDRMKTATARAAMCKGGTLESL